MFDVDERMLDSLLFPRLFSSPIFVHYLAPGLPKKSFSQCLCGRVSGASFFVEPRNRAKLLRPFLCSLNIRSSIFGSFAFWGKSFSEFGITHVMSPQHPRFTVERMNCTSSRTTCSTTTTIDFIFQRLLAFILIICCIISWKFISAKNTAGLRASQAQGSTFPSFPAAHTDRTNIYFIHPLRRDITYLPDQHYHRSHRPMNLSRCHQGHHQRCSLCHGSRRL